MNEVTRCRLIGALLLSFVFLCSSWSQTADSRRTIDLSGVWNFALDPQEKGGKRKQHLPRQPTFRQLRRDAF